MHTQSKIGITAFARLTNDKALSLYALHTPLVSICQTHSANIAVCTDNTHESYSMRLIGANRLAKMFSPTTNLCFLADRYNRTRPGHEINARRRPHVHENHFLPNRV